MKAKQKEPTEKSPDQSNQLNWRQMNRKQRRDLERKIQSADLTLQLVHPDAAGIDIAPGPGQPTGAALRMHDS
jgi:hypothetical protein